MKNHINNRISTVAVTGVFLAISIVLLFLAGIVPGVELTMFAIAGILVTLVIKETSSLGGICLYIASLLLALLLLPNKFVLLPYAFFFGPYSIVREYIERSSNIAVRYILKLVVFNLLVGAGLLIFKGVFLSSMEMPDIVWPMLVIGAEVMFIVYDTILTLAVRVMNKARGRK